MDALINVMFQNKERKLCYGINYEEILNTR